MNLYEILGILFIHWFADFVCQTYQQSINKSKSIVALLAHINSYCMIWLVVGVIYFYQCNLPDNFKIALFCLITYVSHAITDYVTSRINSKLWAQNRVHDFFVSIGFDQFLHYVQLFATYWFLMK